MIQRVLYTALATGLQLVKTDPTLLNEIFGDNYGVPERELSGIRQLFAQQKFTVTHQYPQRDILIPAYSIVLNGEQQSSQYLGRSAGVVSEGDDDYSDFTAGADREGELWQSSYEVICASENPDVTFYMYEVAKAVFSVADDLFLQNGFLEWNLAGMDLARDPRYIPQNLFCRVMSVSVQTEYQVINLASRLGKAFKVTGIAVPPASPYDNGGAPTLVTPYVEGDDHGQ